MKTTVKMMIPMRTKFKIKLNVSLKKKSYWPLVLFYTAEHSVQIWKNIRNMQVALTIEQLPQFKLIRLDMYCNNSSVMRSPQYIAYCNELQDPCKLHRGSTKTVTAIGGSEEAIGTATIQINFLHLVIGVEFQVMRNYIPTLLSMKDMFKINLDNKIQRKVITCKTFYQRLVFEDSVLMHNFNPDDLNYLPYSKS